MTDHHVSDRRQRAPVLAVISLFWKISGHAGSIAFAAAVAVLMLGAPWSPLLLLLLIPAVCWSRVVLRADTVAQVVAGGWLAAASPHCCGGCSWN